MGPNPPNSLSRLSGLHCVARGINSGVPSSTAQKLELQFQNKDELLRAGRDKQAHGKTAPGKTLMSEIDKSVDTPSHNTRDSIAAAANVSTGTVAMAEVVDVSIPLCKKRWRVPIQTNISTAIKNGRQVSTHPNPPLAVHTAVHGTITCSLDTINDRVLWGNSEKRRFHSTRGV